MAIRLGQLAAPRSAARVRDNTSIRVTPIEPGMVDTRFLFVTVRRYARGSPRAEFHRPPVAVSRHRRTTHESQPDRA
ncbi:MAG: hypothetical protein GEU88_19010, partial [Solirubrobacterales bacterium]|nr:hypothetical protein [Solirubrobacterales bacterium]